MKDSLSTSFNSVPSTSWTVYNTLSTLTTTGATIDNGQSNTITANWIGGAPNFAVTLFSGSSATCSSDTTVANTASGVSGQSTTFVVSPTSSTYYCIGVKDSASTAVSANQVTAVQITVNAALGMPLISPTTATIDNGQSISMTASETGGTIPYTYSWYAQTSCGGSVVNTGSSYSPSPSSTTTYSIKVTDNAGATSSCSSGTTVTVDTPSALLTVSNTIADSGQYEVLTATVTGGVGPYTVKFYNISKSAVFNTVSSVASSTTNAFVVSSPTNSNTFNWNVIVIDTTTSGSFTFNSPSNSFTVNTMLATPSISPSNPVFDNGQSTTLTAIETTSGTLPLSYQWYSDGACTTPISGQTGATYSPASSGTYSVKVTDSASTQASQCSSSDTVTISSSALSAGTVTESNTAIDVGQNSLLTANPSGGTAPYTYQWYSGTSPTGTLISGATSQTLLVSPSATTSYYASITDSATTHVTSNSISNTITVYNTPTVTITNPSLTEDVGQSVTFTTTNTPGSGSDTYQWYNTTSGIVQISGQTGTSLTVSGGAIGTFTYNVVITDSNGAKSTSGTGSVVVYALPTVTITNPSLTEDVGQSVTFTTTNTPGSGSDTYQWYNTTSGVVQISGQTGTSLTVSGGAIGTFTYNVVITDSNGKKATSGTGSVVVGNAPSVTITNPSLSEGVGQSVTFTTTNTPGSGSDTYRWYNTTSGVVAIPGQTGTSLTVSGGATGTFTYNVVITDSNGAKAASGTGTVVVTAAPTVTITNPSLAEGIGQSVTFTTTNTPGSGSDTYQWYNTTSGIVQISGQTGTSLTVSGGAIGTFTYNVIITDSHGLHSSSNTGTVVVTNAPTVTITNPSLNEDIGQSVTFTTTNTPGSGSDTYQWYNTTSGVAVMSGQTGTSLMVTGGATGTFAYNVVITDSVGKSATSNAGTVVVGNAPTVTITNPSLSEVVGQNVVFATTNTPGSGSDTYQWYNTTSSVAVMSGQTGTSLTVPGGATGTFTYNVVITDSYGAKSSSNTGNVVVNVYVPGTISAPTPSLSVSDVGQSVVYNAVITGGAGPFVANFVYSNGTVANTLFANTLMSSSARSLTFNSIHLSTGTYTYNIVVTDIDAPPSPYVFNSVSNTMTVNPALSFNVSPFYSVIDPGQNVIFTNSTTGGTPLYTYTYLTNASTTPSNNVYSFPTSGTYYVLEKITDAAGSNVVPFNSIVYVRPVLKVSISPPNSVVTGDGQTYTFFANATGGIGPMTYTWNTGGLTVQSGCGTLSSVCVVSTTGAASVSPYTVNVQISDSKGYVSNTAQTSLTVGSATAGEILPGNETIENGQSITMSVNTVSLPGTGPYTYQWYLNGAPVGTNSSSYVFNGNSSTLAVFNNQLSVTITSNSISPITSPSVYVAVQPALSITSISPSSTVNTIVGNGIIPISVSTSGGFGTLNYSWSMPNGAASCPGYVSSGPTANSFVYYPSGNTSSCIFSVSITDSLGGGPVTSSTQTIKVGTAPPVSITTTIPHGGAGSTTIAQSSTSAAAPQIQLTQTTLLSSITAGATSVSALGLKDSGTVPEVVSLSVPSTYSNFFNLSATNFLLQSGQSVLINMAFNATKVAPGLYTIPVSISATTSSSSSVARSTQVITYSVVNVSNLDVVSQQLYSNNNVSVTIAIHNPKNVSLRNATLEVVLPPYVVTNASQIKVNGNATITFVNGQPHITWSVLNAPKNGAAFVTFNIAKPSNYQLMTLMQNLLVVPSPGSLQLLQVFDISVPTLYTSSTNQITLQALYTGSINQDVDFILSSIGGDISITNPLSTVYAYPQEQLNRSFTIITHNSVGTGTFLLTVRTLGAEINYTIPVMILQKPTQHPASAAEVLSALVAKYGRYVLYAFVAVAVAALALRAINERRGGKRHRFNEELREVGGELARSKKS